jgi:serine/threonine-protein kinase
MIGKLLDHRYQVVRILATGGFGQTYIAQDTRRPGNPICVVKHLKPASSDPTIFATAKRLFQSEAETLEKLGYHDQIPRLLAYFDESQEFFLVQEFIDGHTLSEELIPGHRWSESQVIQLLVEILEILEFVHQQGVIHRDIKPDNIIRRAADYKFVLVDFGAVKQLRSPLVTVGTQTTATVAIGTPGYMPTEQGQGRPRPNSDIYSLGMIAIEALTGVPISQLQEDPETGEIVWQHLVPTVNPSLSAILSKMVRYHFKDRYPTATEALAACRTLTHGNSEASTPSVASVPKVAYQPPQATSGVVMQQTMAVSPGQHPPRPQPVPVRADVSKPDTSKSDTSKPDPLPLLIGILVAGSAAVAVANISPNFQNFLLNFTSKHNEIGNQCLAVVRGNSNIRSEPSAINSDNILKTIGAEGQFEVTGQRTKLGWIQLRLNSKGLAWAHPDNIANAEELFNCLRDQGIAIRTVDDRALIATRPMPKVQPKPVVVVTPEAEEEDKPTSEAEKKQTNSPKTENKDQIIENARQKFESGDLQGAIATLRSIPANAALSIKETTAMINQWQQDWSKAEALANDINKAIDEGKWDKVLAYRDHPEKLPNIKYWQDKLEPLFQQAAENLAKQALPQTKQSGDKNNPVTKPENQDKESEAEETPTP